MMPGHLARSDAPTMATERALRMVRMGLNKSLLAFGGPHRARAPPGQAAPSHPGFGSCYSQATDLAVAAGTAARAAAPMAPKRPRYFIVLAVPVVSAVMTFRRYRSFQELTAPLWQINARLTMAGGAGRRQRSSAASAPDPPGSRGYGGKSRCRTGGYEGVAARTGSPASVAAIPKTSVLRTQSTQTTEFAGLQTTGTGSDLARHQCAGLRCTSATTWGLATTPDSLIRGGPRRSGSSSGNRVVWNSASEARILMTSSLHDSTGD